MKFDAVVNYLSPPDMPAYDCETGDELVRPLQDVSSVIA